MMATIDFEEARLRAREAAWELDAATRWQYFDPERLAVAKEKAREAFDTLVVQTGRKINS